MLGGKEELSLRQWLDQVTDGICVDWFCQNTEVRSMMMPAVHLFNLKQGSANENINNYKNYLKIRSVFASK